METPAASLDLKKTDWDKNSFSAIQRIFRRIKNVLFCNFNT